MNIVDHLILCRNFIKFRNYTMSWFLRWHLLLLLIHLPFGFLLGQDSLRLLPYQESFRFYQNSQTANEENDQESLEQSVVDKLNSFYRQYFQKKDASDLMIHFDLPFDFTPTEHWSINKRRLYIRELFKSEQKKFLIAEAPNLFFAHYAIAKVATQNEQYEKAALHLSQALRFRTLKMSEDVLLNQTKNNILGSNHEEVIFATAYGKAKSDWLRSKQELKEKQRRYWVLYDRSFSPEVLLEQKEQEQEELTSLKEEIPNIKERVEQQRKSFEQMKVDFIPVQRTYNKESADFLEFFIEAMVRQDQRVRILQKSAYQMHQYTRNYSPVIPEVMPEKQDLSLQDHIYTQMLHLDPNRFSAWIKLGEINYLKSDFPKSLDSYSNAAKILEENSLSNERTDENDLSNQRLLYATYKKLSAISLLTKKYPQAAFYLEKATAIQETNNQIDAPMIQANVIQLSRLYSRYNGNYSMSFQILQEPAQTIIQQPLEDLVNEQSIANTRLRTDMQILQNYSTSALKIKDFSAFEAARLKGIEIHQAVLQLLNRVFDEEKQINEELKSLRAQRDDSNSASHIQYNRKQMELEENRKKQQIVLATRNSLPIYDFYLSLAQHYENYGNLIKASDILQQAVRLNVQPSEARKRLLLLKQKLK